MKPVYLSEIKAWHFSFVRYKIRLFGARFFVANQTKLSGWFHLVLNFLGPNDGQGIHIYYNGELKSVKDKPVQHTYAEGDRRIVIGRYYSGNNNTKYDRFASVQVDELLFFNQALKLDEISKYFDSLTVI